ncbi:hypothetical protein CsSME_00001650 [Camellia sinensis var. sinensis]
MAGDGRVVGLGFKGGEASTNYNSNNFLMNGKQNNENLITMPLLSGNFGNNFCNGRGESDRFFGLLNNVSDFDSNSFLQPFGEDDLSFNFLNQINIQSPTQHDDEEFLKSSVCL